MSAHHRAAKWNRVAGTWRKRLAATLPAPCIEVRCVMGGMVLPEDKWEVGHRVALSEGGQATAENIGPTHTVCNRKAGGRLAHEQVRAQKKTDKREFNW